MNRKILMAAIVAVALAGCADAPPSGEFSTSTHGLSADGSVTIDFQQEVKPIEDSAGMETPVECAPDEAPAELDAYKCVDPFTNVTSHFMTLAEPGTGVYSLYFVDSMGTNSEVKIADLSWDNETMWNAANQFDTDYQGMYDSVQLRLDAFVLAVSEAAEAENSFLLFENATIVRADATYKGKDLDVTVSGLQDGVSYTGWLVGEDDAGAIEHLESFSVSNGANTYTAEKNLNAYESFHIHVGDSKVNVAIGSIE